MAGRPARGKILRTAKVDFFADIVEPRTVLGSKCGENAFDTNFWRDYGFLEIFWTERPHVARSPRPEGRTG